MRLPLLIVILVALVPSACPAVPNPTEPLPSAQLKAAKRAKEFFERGNYREAEKIYEGILAAVPNNLYSLTNLGVARFRSGKLQLAEKAILRAIKVAPNDAYSHCILGIIYFSQSRYAEAIAPLERAAKLDPKDATVHNYLGIIYSQKGMQEEAIKELEKAHELDPRYNAREPGKTLQEPPALYRINEA